MEELLKRSERELSQSDMKFFEESFAKYMIEFCDMMTSNVKPITRHNLELYKKFNRKEWIEKVTDDERKQLYPITSEIERTHFTLMFFMDLL